MLINTHATSNCKNIKTTPNQIQLPITTNLIWLLLVLNSHLITPNDHKFVIGGVGVGFFSMFLGMLNNLDYADRHHKTPVIDCNFGYFAYKNTDGYNGSMNPWEYYFEPVSDLQYSPGDKIHTAFKAPDNTQCLYNCKDGYDQKYRNKWFGVINKHIKLKPNIIHKIDFFYENYIASKITVGIHLRGTDKGSEVKQIPPEVILARANNIASKLGKDVQFLVATDEEKLLTLAKSKLNGHVIFYNATRYNNFKFYKSINGIPVFVDPNILNKALLGEEVLIEANLLARCNVLVHTLSNVSLAISFFNPTLVLETLV